MWLAGQARAHDPGLSTAALRVEATTVEAVLTFALADSQNLRLPANDPEPALAQGSISRERIGALVASHFVVRFDDQLASAQERIVQLDATNNLIVRLIFPRPLNTKLSGQSRLIGLLPRGHRQFLSVQDAKGRPLLETLLSADLDTWAVEGSAIGSDPAVVARATSLLSFLRLGIEHILTGYDHLLFLFGLLVVVDNFLSAVRVVSCFTIAHSITLAIATFGLVQIPSRAVEALIAATIVYVGLENLIARQAPKGRWLLTLGFGLVHGFGFATALRERGVGSGGAGILVPLVSFNLGVELGQIAVAALLLPLIWTLKQRPALMHRLVPVCSVMVTLAGAYWLVERMVVFW